MSVVLHQRFKQVTPDGTTLYLMAAVLATKLNPKPKRSRDYIA
jgi:hypothetical protein